MRWNNFLQHGSYFGTRMHRVPLETTSKEIYVGAGREDTFGEIDAEIIMSKLSHDDVDITGTFVERVTDHDKII